MPIPTWLRTPRIRRGLAASAIVLAAGGLVLFRAPTNGSIAAFPQALASPLGNNATSFSGPGASGTVSLSHTKIFASPGEKMFADVHLTADKSDKTPAHAPTSLVVVLDTSGSMSGDKIEEAKNAVIRLMRDMDAEDEIAVIRYSDDAEVIQHLARVGAVREAVITRVQQLRADGGTAIPRGLSRGLDELVSARAGRVKRVVLVSDGLDSTRVEAERLASNSFERGIVISSMGIGLDFDESYMGGVARAGHGNFAFVKDASALASFLRRELIETSTTTVEDAVVRLALPKGVTFVRATGADGKVASDGNEVELRMGSLFAGDERRVLVELSTNLEAGDTRGFEGHASWKKVGGDPSDTSFRGLSIVATRDAQEVEAGRDGNVLASATSVVASRRQVEAAEAYNRGDTTAAQGLIDDNLRDLDAVKKFAPRAAAESLSKQMVDYKETKSGFASAAPTSVAGKSAAKRAVEKDTANMARKAF
jgi:Ca-activated chloride channel homolog